MSDVEIKYILTLSSSDGQALKHLLGNMNDPEFAKFGITGEDRERLRIIWALIPYSDEQN